MLNKITLQYRTFSGDQLGYYLFPLLFPNLMTSPTGTFAGILAKFSLLLRSSY